MSESVADVLKRVRERLSDRRRWTRHTYARAGRRRVYWSDPDATRWCLVGAVCIEAQLLLPDDPWQDALNAVRDCAPVRDLASFNDAKETTHADVLRVLDCAIERAEVKS